MTVSALFYVSVNSGANQSGGVEAPSSATIDFVPASIVGWLRARWEFYDYPEGWSTPAGWSLAVDGTIYYDGITPPQVTLPDNGTLWGVWMPRCLVNEQIDTDADLLSGLLDDDNAICLLSPSGLRDSGAREKAHFTTSTTRVKNWLRSYQRNLRALENPKIDVSTANATPVIARRYLTTADGAYSFRALVNVSDATGANVGEYEVKGGFQKNAGVLGVMYAVVTTTNFESAGLAAADVTYVMDANAAVELQLTGIAAALTWKISEMKL